MNDEPRDPIDRLRTALGERYRVEHEVDRGGMGSVYLAHDLKHRRRVALKVLRPELAALVGAGRFSREIEIAAALHHPNVLPLYDSGAVDELLYYVMPFVEGESLRSRLRREKQLPVEDVVGIAAEVADALAYAHSRGVVHRDIKPENILLESGHALVADFGIARALTATGEDRLTHSGLAVGTPTYMSPEQAGGSDVDARSDIYSLGCVLYEMLAGEPPFHGSTPQAVFARHALEQPPSLEVVRPTLGEPVLSVVQRALAKSPADRFQTAGEFRSAIRGPAQPVALAPARPRRARSWLGMASVVVAVIAVIVVPRLIGNGPAANVNHVVVFPVDAADPQLEATGAGVDVAFAIGAALEHSQPLKWIDGWSRLSDVQRTDARLITSDVARRITRERGARFYIDGAIRRSESRTAVMLRLNDAVGDSLVAQETAEGSAASEFGDLALAAVTPLLARLLEPLREVDLSPLRDRNPAANALAIQGDREYRRSHFGAALEFYRRATHTDSLHVFAAIKGAQAASWVNRPTEAGQLLEHALTHAELLPEKYRLLARGLDAYYAGRANSAASLFRTALAIDSSWTEAWMGLGDVYYHLLPSEAPLDSLAEAAFRAAVHTDPAFSPALVHLAEIAIRGGDAAEADSVVSRLEFVRLDTTLARQLALMSGCVRAAPAVSWDDAARDTPAAVILAAKGLAGGAAHSACAQGGFRAILARPELPGGYKWAALLGLHGLLLVERRYDEARSVLDSSISSGMTAAHTLFVLGALAGAPFDDAAGEAERLAREGAGEHYERGEPETQWLLGVWQARRGNVEKLAELERRLRDRAVGDAADQVTLLADALAAHHALALGDSLDALRRLRALGSVEPANRLSWSASAPLPVERYVLAQLLLAQGRHDESLRVASVFDHHGPIMFLPFLRASIELRLRAAQGLRRPDLIAEFERRLRTFGRS